MQVMKGGWPHRLTNLANATARLVEIDVQNNIAPERALCGLAAIPCTDGRFGKTEEGTYIKSTLFETSKGEVNQGGVGSGRYSRKTRPFRIRITHPSDSHPSYRGHGERYKRDLGETQAYPAGTDHQIRNIGAETARFLEFELK
jgi:hypothetical protein